MKTIAPYSDNVLPTNITIIKSRKELFFILGFLDFLLLNISFWGIHWFKYQDFSLSEVHKEMYVVILVLWLLTTLYWRKLAVPLQKSFWSGLRVITRTCVGLIMLISLTIICLRLTAASRLLAYGSCLSFYLLEVIVYSIFSKWLPNSSESNPAYKSAKPEFDKNFILFSGIDGALWLLSLQIVAYVDQRNLIIDENYLDLAVISCFLWIVISFFTNKHNKINYNHFNLWLSANIKSAVIMAGGLSLIVFGTRFFEVTRFTIFGPIIICLFLEYIVFYIYFLYIKHGGNIQDLEDSQSIGKIIEADRILPDNEVERERRIISDPVTVKLKNALEFLNPQLFHFINETINLDAIDRVESVLIKTDNLLNVTTLDQRSLRIFINLHKLNDMRWFNKYFLSVHSKLVAGGYFVGHAHTIETQKTYFHEKYPRYINFFIYGLFFFWKRVMPKLPWTRKLYFAITKGRNRTVSRAEVFGRLYFCGFKIVSEHTWDNRLYFIAQKVKLPSLNQNPSLAPIICLKRFGGLNGPINVYKFRTMYPYSEFLQQYVYEKSGLAHGGKLKNDFRVTSWGRFLRQTWLDELPMLYNWLKGDLKLIGVRPLSKQYLGLYNIELRNLRTKVKPGLIPPFYADLPCNLAEIQDSEKRYIESYLRRPITTQIRYLYKSILNILFKHIRSA